MKRHCRQKKRPVRIGEDAKRDAEGRSISLAQKYSFAPNWKTRGSNAEVTWPKLLDPSPLLTWSNSVWFQTLKLSARSSRRRLSLKLKLLKSDRFQLSRPGPRNELNPALPHAPTAGLAKPDVLNPSPPLCGYETLPIRFGRLVAFGKPLLLWPPVSCGLIGS